MFDSIRGEPAKVIHFDNHIADDEEAIKNISEVPQNLTNYFRICDHQADKVSKLLTFLSKMKGQRMIIFFATCASVNYHYLALQQLISDPNLDYEGDEAEIYKLHGKIDQKRRTKIYREFRQLKTDEGKHLLLLTTDLASRGIDIPEVDWIIQFDPPQSSDSFVHRIGRTARAGKLG